MVAVSPAESSSFTTNSSKVDVPLANCSETPATAIPARAPKITAASVAPIPASPTVVMISPNDLISGLMSSNVRPRLASAASFFDDCFVASSMAILNALPARLPSRPRLRNCATAAVVCSSVIPNCWPVTPANFMASRRLPMDSCELFMAVEKTSAILADSLAGSWNCDMVEARMLVASVMLDALAPASRRADSLAAMVSAGVRPALASSIMPSAACDAEKAVVAPRLRACSVSASSSSREAPLTAATVVIDCSKSAPTLTETAPNAAMAAVAAFRPVTTAPSIMAPTFDNDAPKPSSRFSASAVPSWNWPSSNSSLTRKDPIVVAMTYSYLTGKPDDRRVATSAASRCSGVIFSRDCFEALFDARRPAVFEPRAAKTGSAIMLMDSDR